MIDPAKELKTYLAPMFGAMAAITLEVADDYQPKPNHPTVLIADDGSSMLSGGAWMVGNDLMRTTIRVTAFAAGRTEAREIVGKVVDAIRAYIPASRTIARLENLPGPLETKDRATGAYLASVILPIIVRPH